MLLNNYEDYLNIIAYNEEHKQGDSSSKNIRIDPKEFKKTKFISLHDSVNNRPLWQDYTTTKDENSVKHLLDLMPI